MAKVSKIKNQHDAGGSLQVMRGRVVSAKMPKTVTVLIERTRMHPLYKKSFKRSKKYLVHTEIQTVEGDLVEIVKIRPMSKNKHWQVAKVVGKDIEAIVVEQLKEEAAEAIAEVMPFDTDDMGDKLEKEKAESSDENQESSPQKSKKLRTEGRPRAKKLNS